MLIFIGPVSIYCGKPEVFLMICQIVHDVSMTYFQIIMVRLQRVTVLALHNYLGLTNELFSHVSLYKYKHTHSIMQTSDGNVVWHFIRNSASLAQRTDFLLCLKSLSAHFSFIFPLPIHIIQLALFP